MGLWVGGKELIQVRECEWEYPTMTKFKVWVGKELKGEYSRSELMEKFKEYWLDYCHEESIKLVEVHLYKSFSKRY